MPVELEVIVHQSFKVGLVINQTLWLITVIMLLIVISKGRVKFLVAVILLVLPPQLPLAPAKLLPVSSLQVPGVLILTSKF